jgi:Spy/CpxP family protein refolding chaperone
MKAHRMQRGLILIALIGCLVALFPRPASSQMMVGPEPPEMNDEMGGGLDLPLFLRSGNLTPDQRAQVNRILDRNHPAFAGLFGQIHQQRQQLDDKLFTPGPVDTTAVEKISQSLSQLQAQLADLELKTMLQIRALMTPAQLSRVADFHHRLESLHQQMHELMEENGPPGPFHGPHGPHLPGPPPMGPPPGE